MEKLSNNYFLKNEWKIKKNGKSASKIFNFKSFKEAFSWMTELAIWSELLNHHPEWSNVYNRVTVNLTTHDFDKITKKDKE